jgi:hypothetical protein
VIDAALDVDQPEANPPEETLSEDNEQKQGD